MNTNPHAKRILCYGDSNTWGKVPATKHERYPTNIRWTGILQTLLGQDYEIIEEGLKSRTINLDDPDPTRPGRNGLKWLMPCLESHNPIDLIFLMLGTNDLRARYNRTSQQVADSLHSLFKEIEAFSQKVDVVIPQVLLVAPPTVVEVESRENLFTGADTKSKELAALYSKVSDDYDYSTFVDAAGFAQPSLDDGIHLDENTHRVIAERLFDLVRSLDHKLG